MDAPNRWYPCEGHDTSVPFAPQQITTPLLTQYRSYLQTGLLPTFSKFTTLSKYFTKSLRTRSVSAFWFIPPLLPLHSERA
jgi:hypothetical protein